MTKFFLNLTLFSVCLVCVFTISCMKNGSGTGTTDVYSKSMLVNGADTSAMDFYINATKMNTTAIAFGGNSGYYDTKLTTGVKTKIAVKSSTTALSFADSVLMTENIGYSFFVFRDSNAVKTPRYKISIDDLSVPGANKAKIRFAHLVNNILSYGLDIETVAPGGSPSARNDLSNIRFKDVTNFIEIAAGSKDVKIKISGQTNLVTTISNTNFVAGKIYTIVLEGKTGSLKTDIITNL